jgi:rhodanese-related sulfurtransferase
LKIKNILIGVVAFSAFSFAEFKDVDANTLVAMQKKGVPIIDIRTPEEWKARGIIPGAHPIMFFDRNRKPHAREWLIKLSKLVKDKKSPFIIYCAHANRTKAVGKWLTQKMGFQNVYELKGGIEYGWIDKGKKTIKVK